MVLPETILALVLSGICAAEVLRQWSCAAFKIIMEKHKRNKERKKAAKSSEETCSSSEEPSTSRPLLEEPSTSRPLLEAEDSSEMSYESTGYEILEEVRYRYI